MHFFTWSYKQLGKIWQFASRLICVVSTSEEKESLIILSVYAPWTGMEMNCTIYLEQTVLTKISTTGSHTIKTSSKNELKVAVNPQFKLYGCELTPFNGHMDKGNNSFLSLLFLASACLDILSRKGRKMPKHRTTKESRKCLKYRAI